MSSTRRFAVDRMLGRLATWLRLIGEDATYGAHLSGQSLLRHARNEGRTVLTRDHRLPRRAEPPPLLFIASDRFREQLREVVTAFDLDPFAHPFTRCARCNEALVVVAKMDIVEQLAPYVAATQERFVRCPRCQRIYWPATHYRRTLQELRAMGFTPREPTPSPGGASVAARNRRAADRDRTGKRC
jgi:uncharacterized protein with PIN domain